MGRGAAFPQVFEQAVDAVLKETTMPAWTAAGGLWSLPVSVRLLPLQRGLFPEVPLTEESLYCKIVDVFSPLGPDERQGTERMFVQDVEDSLSLNSITFPKWSFSK